MEIVPGSTYYTKGPVGGEAPVPDSEKECQPDEENKDPLMGEMASADVEMKELEKIKVLVKLYKKQ